MRNISIAILALAGLALSGLMIYKGQKEIAFSPVVSSPSAPPFENFIAAQGIIEAAYKNIPIGASYADVITDIYVNVGDVVKKGAPLFKTDTRHFEALLNDALADQAVAEEEYRNQELQFSYYKELSNKNAVSKLMYTDAYYKKNIARKRLEKAKTAVQVHAASIDRSCIKAPIDGEVLQVNIRVGQYAYQIFISDIPFILFGDHEYLHVRIDIGEEDAWRYEKGKPALGYVRGNKKISIPLEYVYIEPYIIPKKSLTGSDVERVDTRVLQVVYRFKKNESPIFMGQLLDVYIQSKRHEGYK